MDKGLRRLERKYLSASAPENRDAYIKALLKLGFNPYWISVREKMPHRDTVYYDEELHYQETRYREAMIRDPNQTWLDEPELYIASHRHPDGVPRWEDRGLSGDKHWELHLNVPQSNGSLIHIWLGEVYAYAADDQLLCTVKTHRDLFSFDEWAASAGTDDGAVRANYSLSRTLQGSGLAFTYKAILNMELPLHWDPTHPISTSRYGIRPLNRPATDPNAERPHNTDLQMYREGEPLIDVPYHREFYIGDFLADLFFTWVFSTTAAYGQALADAIHPPGPKLKTTNEGRWIYLHYWQEGDSLRFIEGTDDPADPIHKQARYVYGVSYKVKWVGDYSARFWRWSHDDGSEEVGHSLSSSDVSPQVHSDELLAEVQQRSWSRLQTKLGKMIAVAEKWGYRVVLVEGEPPRSQRSHTWRAGMQWPTDDTDQTINFFR